MKISFLVFANKITGLGHWYRSIALAQHAQDNAHQVTIISDRQPPTHFAHHQVSYEDQDLWHSPLLSRPDWLVIDLPDEAPGWLYQVCRLKGIQTCILNGVGHQIGDRADLRIVQGLGEGDYSGVDYIILRPQVFDAKKLRRPVIDWFVFGGAADKMHLTRSFPNWPRIVFTVSEEDWNAADNHDNGFLMAASQCKRACVAMGMTPIELSIFGDMPIYVFSVSSLHLRFAQGLEAAGYVKSYPVAGLPCRQNMIDFLNTPFEPSGKPIDGLACERILDLMLKG